MACYRGYARARLSVALRFACRLAALSAEILIATIALRTAGARTTERRRLAMAAVTLFAGVMLFAYVDPGWVAKKLGSVAHVNSAWANWAGDRKSMALDSLHVP